MQCGRAQPSAHWALYATWRKIAMALTDRVLSANAVFVNYRMRRPVWRTGANEATTFVTNENLLVVKRSNVRAGSYTIFTVPDPDKWTLIINKHTGESGTPYKYESEELARVPMSVTKLPSPVDNFTISFDHTDGSCTMRMSWENTQASLDFTEKNADLPVIN